MMALGQGAGQLTRRDDTRIHWVPPVVRSVRSGSRDRARTRPWRGVSCMRRAKRRATSTSLLFWHSRILCAHARELTIESDSLRPALACDTASRSQSRLSACLGNAQSWVLPCPEASARHCQHRWLARVGTVPWKRRLCNDCIYTQ